MFGGLENILNGNQTMQLEFIVDDQNTLDAVLMHQGLGLFDAAAFANRNKLFLWRHDLTHGLIQIVFKAQVTVSDNTNNPAALVQHRQTGNTVLTGERQHLTNGHVRIDRDRVFQDTRFITLDLGNFSRLLCRRQVLVNNADTAFLRQSNG